MGLNTKYAQEIYEQLGYLATWLPTANVQVGDVGVIVDGIFEKKGNLTNFGVDFESQFEPQTGNIEYASKDAISTVFKAAGNAPVAAGAAGVVNTDASVAVSFARADAVLLQATGCKTATLSDLPSVSDAILSLYDSGNWPANRVVVTDVLVSDVVTVLISSGADAHLDLSIKGALGIAKVDLASAGAQYSVDASKSMGTQIVAAKHSTPLFKASGVKTSLWRDPILAKRDGDRGKLAPLTYIDLVGPPAELAG